MTFFVGLSMALLLALSLLSYSPHDPSFNVSAPLSVGQTHNWIGPVGAHMADLFFQFAGYSAFLFPIDALTSGARDASSDVRGDANTARRNKRRPA